MLELISELIRIVSFTFRLFGNIFAGEVLLLMMSFLVPLVLINVFYGLELFVGLIQAFVFAMLTLVFAQTAVTSHHGDEHEEHGGQRMSSNRSSSPEAGRPGQVRTRSPGGREYAGMTVGAKVGSTLMPYLGRAALALGLGVHWPGSPRCPVWPERRRWTTCTPPTPTSSSPPESRWASERSAPAIGIGYLGGKAMEALGSQPRGGRPIQTNMILAIAFAEAIGIYALVVAILIGFVF